MEPPPRPLPPIANPTPPRRVPNARRDFWITDAETSERRQIAARLRVQLPHVAMWIEEGVWHDVQRLEAAAVHFETDLYPSLRAAFGSEWTPGIDGDPRVNVLHASGLGESVLGYTSSRDEYPQDRDPLSNEAEMITINVGTVDVGSSSYRALLARGLFRLIQWHQDRNEERWVREGLATLAAPRAGSDAAALHQAYLQDTDIPLTAWRDAAAHRGAAHLLMTYLHQRFGDEAVRALVAEPANGVKGFNAALQSVEAGVTFEDLFADWLAANYLDSVLEADDGPYTYPDLDLGRPTLAALYESYPAQLETSVHQFGADYVVLRGEEDLQIQFTGETETLLLTDGPHLDGPVWWSNGADESRTTLTRRFDLSELGQATLIYRVWYDIEPHYDYATVAVGTEGGDQWHLLRAPSGTEADPHGNNPGRGYTGRSDGWIQEEVDLSDYAGDEVLIRFSYLTDGAVTGEGLLLDAVSIPQIEGQENQSEAGVEGNGDGWDPRGFLLTDGLVPQDYLALLIRYGYAGEDVTVERLPFREDRSAEWVVPLSGRDPREAVLILSAMAPRTHQPAPYRLTISH